MRNKALLPAPSTPRASGALRAMSQKRWVESLARLPPHSAVYFWNQAVANNWKSGPFSIKNRAEFVAKASVFQQALANPCCAVAC